jgi:hypothetical protein
MRPRNTHAFERLVCLPPAVLRRSSRSPEKLMKAWLEPMWPEIETLASVSDYPVVNKKRVEEYALVLWRHWRKLTT